MGVAEADQGFSSQCSRLVEAALGVLRAVQRNGYDKHLGRCFICQLCNGDRQHLAEIPSGRMQAVVFEHVNRIAHAAFVDAVSNGAREGRRGEAAGATEQRA